MPRKFLGGKPTVGTTNTPVVIESRTITATDPVTIAGGTSADLSSDRTIAVKDANTSGQAGVVSLTDSTSTTSSTIAATATAVKAAKDAADAKVPTTRTISTTSPITGGGDLSTDRTIAINDGTTAQKGAVQLTDSTSSTSTTTAATPNSVKTAYDLAAAAVPKSTVTTAGDLIVATGSAAVTRLAAGASGAALVGTGAGSAPAYSTTINGTAIPSSKTLAVTTDKLSVFAATSSSELAGVISDETGSGALVFATTPTLTTPVITQGTSTPSFSSNSYTVTTGDEGKMLLASNSTTAGSVKIPTNATTAFAVGTQIHVIQTDTGQLTISAVTSGTTTVRSAGSGTDGNAPKLRAKYSAATMLKTATDTWYVFGDIA